MPARLRLLLRAVRVLVACLVLGLVAAPATAAPAVAAGDAIPWVAGASCAEASPRAPVARRRAARAPISAAPRSDPRAARHRVVRRSARARDVVVRHRVYLRNASLLR
jgi:hypothetical protein